MESANVNKRPAPSTTQTPTQTPRKHKKSIQTPTLQKSLDGCYTRMLRAVLNVDRNIHITNKDLYGKLPRLSRKVAARRMRMAGHCHRHRELPASTLVLWEPLHGHRSRGRSALTYVDVLKKDAGAESSSELAGCMENREDWRLRWKLV